MTSFSDSEISSGIAQTLNAHIISGRIFSEYKCISKIGEGSFSEVMKVSDKHGQHYAAKKLLRSYCSMDEVMKVNEIRAMKTMDYHPNVISIVDILL